MARVRRAELEPCLTCGKKHEGMCFALLTIAGDCPWEREPANGVYDGPAKVRVLPAASQVVPFMGAAECYAYERARDAAEEKRRAAMGAR